MEEIKGIDVVEMAKEFHRVYEKESVEAGWKTQKECQVSFMELPERNRTVMLRTCALMIQWINENQERI